MEVELSLSFSDGLWVAPDINLASCFVSVNDALDLHEVRGQVARHVCRGRGFIILRSPPPSKCRESARSRIFAMATAVGRTKPQNAQREHVTDLIDTPDKADWSASQPFHTDAGDLLFLYCIQPAQRGGHTRLASAAAAYRQLQEQSPDAAQLLREHWHFNRKGRPGPSTFARPIIENSPDRPLSCFYLPGTLRMQFHNSSSQETALRLRALTLFDDALENGANNISLKLVAGDCLIVNNSRVLHARTAYTDGPNPRLLLRCWVDVPE
ncbi:MAG: TauD/TfdA family dioxygenase [Solirubrobacteraceae bacterium]